jgi:Glutamate/Leucine/Phenylalanine/Valine dehydrogenase
MVGVQGFGNVGSWAAEIFHEHGGKLQAVSDAFGAVYNEKGLDIPALRRHIANRNSLESFPGGMAPSLARNPRPRNRKDKSAQSRGSRFDNAWSRVNVMRAR